MYLSKQQISWAALGKGHSELFAGVSSKEIQLNYLHCRQMVEKVENVKKYGKSQTDLHVAHLNTTESFEV